MCSNGAALTTVGPCPIGQSSPANHRCHALCRRLQSPREMAVCERMRSYTGQQTRASLAMQMLLQQRPHMFQTHGQPAQHSQASQTAALACLLASRTDLAIARRDYHHIAPHCGCECLVNVLARCHLIAPQPSNGLSEQAMRTSLYRTVPCLLTACTAPHSGPCARVLMHRAARWPTAAQLPSLTAYRPPSRRAACARTCRPC